jgi:hypothetical protein
MLAISVLSVLSLVSAALAVVGPGVVTGYTSGVCFPHYHSY